MEIHIICGKPSKVDHGFSLILTFFFIDNPMIFILMIKNELFIIHHLFVITLKGMERHELVSIVKNFKIFALNFTHFILS